MTKWTITLRHIRSFNDLKLYLLVCLVHSFKWSIHLAASRDSKHVCGMIIGDRLFCAGMAKQDELLSMYLKWVQQRKEYP